MTVPQKKAPQQTGYNIVPLNAELSKASVIVVSKEQAKPEALIGELALLP
ncbi:hypothetical protein [Paenibacillus farraposensis]|nr:hypothetical protein [Paenibacillus farraposensis]